MSQPQISAQAWKNMSSKGSKMEQIAFNHVSVLLKETVDGLNLKPGAVIVDGTMGFGGHTQEVLKRLDGTGRVICIDQDADAIAAATKRLEPWSDQIQIVRSNYVDMPLVLDSLGVDQVDGIMLDLGVSSFQLDEASRGFTYRMEGPLDMRMDQRNPVTAADLVNTCSKEELLRILWDYGEERYARNIVDRILKEREIAPIETTTQLVDIIRASIPAKARNAGGHPAKRTFQALRIEVNHELDVLTDSIDAMIDRLAPGGRLCIITFQSLEDRIVKNQFKKNENPCTCPPEFPVCVCGKQSKGRAVTRKPILPTKEEIAQNKRSKSAKLRIFEKR